MTLKMPDSLIGFFFFKICNDVYAKSPGVQNIL